MARLIDAEKVLNSIDDLYKIARAMVNDAANKAADGELVKHGKWLPDKKFGTDVMAGNTICSNCGLGAWDQPRYCPHCGSKNVEEEDNGQTLL